MQNGCKNSLSRVLSLLCVTALTLAGCSGSSPSPSQNTASGDPAADNVSPAGTFPIVSAPITLRLAVQTSPQVEDLTTNYYTQWLQDKSGITLEFDMLPAKDTAQKVQVMLAGNTDLPDAFIGLGRSTTLFNATNAQKYGEEGQIIPLNDYIEQYGENTKQFFEEFSANNVKSLMTSADGNIYSMPGYSSSDINFYGNKMWLNAGWLEKLNLDAPTTTDAFYETLKAFKEKDPNGNGKTDEIPLAGTELVNAGSVYDYLINAFIYNDQNNSRLTVTGGKLGFAPITDEWREAMQYLNKLCSEGLLSSLSFTQDQQQLQQMANDKNDILGMFAGLGIQMGAQANDQEAKARYTGLAPLTGPKGVRLATAFSPLPYANGVITTSCENPAALVRLFDLMLSEEACLLGRYGIKGQDWDTPAEGDKSIYGTQATVNVINQIWGPVQNTHWLQQCPYISRPKYSGGAGWNGDPYDVEYMNAQCSILYRGTEPEEYVVSLIYSLDEVEDIREIKTNIDQYVKEMIAKFTVGEINVFDDAVWQKYVSEFENLELTHFMEINQTVYDRMNA